MASWRCGPIQVGIVGSALGWPISVERLAPFGMGALFVWLGNLLPRFRANFFIGIRTPWTLGSESVWTCTRRVGGYMMVLLGLLLVIAGIVETDRWFYVAIGGGVVMVLVALVCSYVSFGVTNSAMASRSRHSTACYLIISAMKCANCAPIVARFALLALISQLLEPDLRRFGAARP